MLNILKKKVSYCLNELDNKDPKVILAIGVFCMILGMVLVNV